MSGLILPDHYHYVRPIGRGEDIADITRSVQDGDPTVGWRGDAAMDVYREGSCVYVAGFDAKGERYIAARTHMARDDWRRDLLERLRDGDWQNEANFAEVTRKKNEKVLAERDSKHRDKIAEIADKYVSAVARDNNSKRFF